MKRVVLLIENNRGFGRALLKGIAQYASMHGPWTFYHSRVFYLDEHGRTSKSELSRIKNWGADGIIAREFTAYSRNEISSLGIPGVISTVFNEDACSGLGDIFVENREIGVMAAEHLLERGFRNFAFCGLDDFFWSWRRFEGFSETIKKAGYETHLYKQPKSKIKRLWDNEQMILADWLKSLPKPVGIMCCIDERSRHVVSAGKIAGIHMPEEVALIGGDNDDLICELSNPQLSSVAINGYQAGYQVAELLDELMKGNKPASTTVRVKPTFVVTRHSTDILAIEDEDISGALRYIRFHGNEPIQVEDVAREVAMSRQGLNKKFRKYLGRTIHEEIKQVRVELIARQLIETSQPVGQIANKLGFTDMKHLSRVFSSVKGVSPSEFRRIHL